MDDELRKAISEIRDILLRIEAHESPWMDEMRRQCVADKAPNTVLPGKSAGGSFGRSGKQLLLIGSAVLGALVLMAVIVISLQTKDATLVIEINEPDAEIQVLNEDGKIEIAHRGEKGPITMSITPGRHHLKVQKYGFELFSNAFEIKSGTRMSITAKLVPIEDMSTT